MTEIITPALEPTTPEKKDLAINKLIPPLEIRHRIIQKDKERLPDNKILRFLKLFFGEGF